MPKRQKLQPVDDGYRVSDAMWQKVQPLLPPPKPHPLGTYRRPIPDRVCLDAILLVLRTGMPWNALNITGPCKSTAAYDRFRLWVEAGVFLRMWQMALMEYDDLKGIDWSWLSMDGAMTKAPLGGEKGGAESHRPRQRRRETLSAVRSQGSAAGLRGGRRESQ